MGAKGPTRRTLMLGPAENFCPLADHYTKCPQFRKNCDAINCEGNKIVREILKQRDELARHAKKAGKRGS